MCRKTGVQVGTILGEGLPPKIWEGKKRLKFGTTSDNYRLRSWIFPERVKVSRIGKVVGQLQLLACWAKKEGELWSTKKKVIGAHVDSPKWNFGAISDNFPLWFARWRCCPRNLNHPKLSLQSDLRRRAVSCWALPHISSLLRFQRRSIYERSAVLWRIPNILRITVRFRMSHWSRDINKHNGNYVKINSQRAVRNNHKKLSCRLETGRQPCISF